MLNQKLKSASSIKDSESQISEIGKKGQLSPMQYKIEARPQFDMDNIENHEIDHRKNEFDNEKE